MSTGRKVWRNGKFIDWDQATVHVLSHAFSRASAIFDFLGIYATDHGPAAFRIDDHIDRLFFSAKLLGMKLSYNKDGIRKGVLEAVRENEIKQGFVKIIAYWSEEAVLTLVPHSELDVDIFTIPAEENDCLQRAPIKACISKWCKIPPDCLPTKAKACAHYLNSMLARADAQSRGFDIGILLDMRGFVAESSIETLFVIKDGVLITPNLGWILKSVSRQTILEIAHSDGFEIDEGPLSREELLNADEIFTSTTPSRVQTVCQIDNRILDAPGSLSKRISALFADVLKARAPQYKKWLTYI